MLNIKKIFDQFCYIVIDDNNIITKISKSENENVYSLKTYIKNTLVMQCDKLITHNELCLLLESYKIISVMDKNDLVHCYDTASDSFVY